MLRQEDKAFYDRCAEILGVPHDFAPFPFDKRSRWNNRKPGSGRFPGRGLVRAFGPHVHLSLYRPRPINRLFDSRDAALRCLEELCESRALSAGAWGRHRELRVEFSESSSQAADMAR